MLRKEKMFKLNFKKVFAFLFALILCFGCIDVYADDGGYTIDNYTVNATYNSNNTIDVKEVIDVNFSSYRHGIYRNIPETMYINRDEKYKLKIQDITVLNDEYEVDSDSGNRVIQIGSADYTIIGPHTYTLTYKIVIPEDYHSDLDFIYYSVLGNNWDTTINHFSFNVQFEKALTENEISNIQIFSGTLGNQSNDLNVQPSITSNSITGSAYDIGPKQAITIFGKLRKNYFVGAKQTTSKVPFVFLGLAILFGLYSLIRALLLKKAHITPIVNFYPPKDMDPAMVGTIVDESVDQEDLMALIPYWASKGYLTISEKEDDLVLTKVENHEPPVLNHQKKIYKGLFKYKDSVKLSNLSSNFGKAMNDAKEALNNEFSGEKKLSKIDHGFVTTVLAMICMIVCILFNTRYSIVDNLIETILATFTFVIMMVMNYSVAASSVFNKNKLGVLKKALSVALVLVVVYFIYRQTQSIVSIVSFEFMVIGIVATTLPILFSSRFNVVSDYFKSVAGDLLGFKDFIEKAEVPQLERLSAENPSYYYDVIPYAMVFGLSEMWTKKFSTIPLAQPDWYDSYYSDPYTSYFYYRMLTRSMYEPIHQNLLDYQTEQMKSTADSMGSSFGGFSGGGAGGGGGGSW